MGRIVSTLKLGRLILGGGRTGTADKVPVYTVGLSRSRHPLDDTSEGREVPTPLLQYIRIPTVGRDGGRRRTSTAVVSFHLSHSDPGILTQPRTIKRREDH